MRLKLKVISKAIGLTLLSRRNSIKRLLPKAYKMFKKLTPEDTGYAKRRTRLQGQTIIPDYPYASVLDAGRGYRDGQMRGSKQAPEGMTKPTIEKLGEQTRKIFK